MDEVFGLQGMSEEDDSEDDDDMIDDDEGLPNPMAKPTANKKASTNGKRKAVVSSSSSESESEEAETWGRNKSAYYSSNAADLDSDDEEGHELEVQEAKRLLAKTRETLTDNDFGLDDPIDVAAKIDEVE